MSDGLIGGDSGECGSREDEIRFSCSEDRRMIEVVLNRPAKRNALSPELARRIRVTLESSIDARTQLIVFRSDVPGVFCAGFDISHMGGAADAGDPACELYELYAWLESVPPVTLAYADGFVVGGGVELFLCCDLRLASHAATFRVPPARLSLVYERDGIARFLHRIGAAATSEMFLGARTMDASDALRCGLATRLVEAVEVRPYCAEILQGAPLAQRAMKEIIASLGQVTEADRAAQERFLTLKNNVLQSFDHAEALAAFREKRPPRFEGR